jgi:hypothetical protein
MRDGLIRVAESNLDWVIGFEDETWWSRLARPSLHAWVNKDENLHLVEQSVPKEDKSPKALACYGMLLRYQGERNTCEKVRLRFVEGQPVSNATIAFLDWSCERIVELGKKTLLLIWDNATWHNSRRVEEWIVMHNQQVKEEKRGIRIIRCRLPKKSPWLNPIEAHWVHGKRQVVEPGRLLTSEELVGRVCDYFDSLNQDNVPIPEYVS